MKNRNMSFLDAVKYLASRANITLELQSEKKDKSLQKKELLYRVNLEAGKFFFSNLMRGLTHHLFQRQPERRSRNHQSDIKAEPACKTNHLRT